MKKIFVLFIFINVLSAYSQVDSSFKLYMYPSYNLGGGVSCEATTQFTSMFNCGIVGSRTFEIYKDIPSDYNGEGLTGTDTPCQVFETYGIFIGKYFGKESIRLNAKLGLIHGSCYTPSNFQKIEKTFNPWISAPLNYTYSMKRENYIGMILAPSLEIKLWKYLGLSTGVTVDLNKVKSQALFNVGLLLGAI